MAVTSINTAMGELVISNATPDRIAQLQRHAEIFRTLPQCRALADHPRYDRQTCLTVLLDDADPCPNAHRHISKH